MKLIDNEEAVVLTMVALWFIYLTALVVYLR